MNTAYTQEFFDFVTGLTNQQVLALACQSGVKDWNTRPVEEVRRIVATSPEAEIIWGENFA